MMTMQEVFTKRAKEIAISFETARDSIVPRFVSETERENLNDKISSKVCDLVVTYHISLGGNGEGGVASIPITKSLSKLWNVSVKDIHEAAIENLKKNPVYFKSMAETLAALTGGLFQIPDEGGFENESMFVLSNPDKHFGAVELLNPEIMNKISIRFPEGFYILPSSIHEVIIVKKINDANEFKNMVCEINSGQVGAEDRLSNNVYEYDSVTQNLDLATI